MEPGVAEQLMADLPAGFDPAEARRLIDFLESLGATPAELGEAVAAGNIGGLALELAMRGDQGAMPFRQAAESTGQPLEEAARYWRALGFPDPDPDAARLPVDAVDALALVATAGRDLLGEESALRLARVLGASTSRLAQAMVDVFRVQFESRRMAEGASYPEVVEQYVALARTVLPPFVAAMGAVFQRHLVIVASGTWSADAEGSTARRNALVGFVDLAGYTALSQTLRPGELADLISDFEELVTDAVVRHRGRVVKLIGDAALFTVDDAGAGCRVALEIVEGANRSGRLLPHLRAGLAAGDVMTLQGDVFGDVVNMAARLVAAAPENGVLATDEVRRRAGEACRFTALPPQTFKGIETPTTAYLVGPQED
jgi:class 3 adenylate cyclase